MLTVFGILLFGLIWAFAAIGFANSLAPLTRRLTRTTPPVNRCLSWRGPAKRLNA